MTHFCPACQMVMGQAAPAEWAALFEQHTPSCTATVEELQAALYRLHFEAITGDLRL